MITRNILFGLLWPGLGGLTRSALAIAKQLRMRGHTVDFVVDSTADSNAMIADAGFHILHIRTRPLFQQGVSDALRRIVLERGYDVLHWFQEDHATYEAAHVARETGRAFIWTHASGRAPNEFFGLNRIVVLTHEVADEVRQKHPEINVSVLPARIEARALTAEFSETAKREIRSAYDIPDSDLLVVRVARCLPIYVHSIRLGIRLVEALNAAGRHATFLHAGYPSDAAVTTEVRQRVDDLNRRSGRRVAITETRDVALAVKHMAAADVCIASGRSAVEALALGRSTLAAFGPRYVGIVDDQNLQQMADINFQGRKIALSAVEDDDVAMMLRDVQQRLSDPAAARIQSTCARIVMDHYSVEQAVGAYESLYEDRHVAVLSPFQRYGGPRYLQRELRRWLGWTPAPGGWSRQKPDPSRDEPDRHGGGPPDH